MWGKLGYSTARPQRSPLAYVMEAADDIAYCISDLEDSIEKELLNQDLVFGALREKWVISLRSKKNPSRDIHWKKFSKTLRKAARSKLSDSYTFTNFRTALAQILTDTAFENYCQHHGNILDGSSEGLISENSAAGALLDLLKDYCRENVYSHYSVHKKELGGYAAIIGLLDHFGILLKCNSDRFQRSLAGKNKDENEIPIILEKKLIALLPEKHVQAYKVALKKIQGNVVLNPSYRDLQEWNLRAHLIIDFISGMTDDFALKTYQSLSGIKIE